MSGWKSMSGYGEARRESGRWTVVVQARSVNQRNRDVRVLTQPRVLAWEHGAAARVQRWIERGKVELRIALEPAPGAAAAAGRAELIRLKGERWRLRTLLGETPPLHLKDAAPAPDETAVAEADLHAAIDAAVAALDRTRAEEGAALHGVVAGQLDAMASLCGRLRDQQAADAGARERHLATQLERLRERGLGVEDADRIRDEVAMLLVRADVAEELDRLDAHLAAAQALLETPSPVGKRLDVLAQELGREAHTTSAKAATPEGKALAVELRHVIEQLREQVQNIE